MEDHPPARQQWRDLLGEDAPADQLWELAEGYSPADSDAGSADAVDVDAGWERLSAALPAAPGARTRRQPRRWAWGVAAAAAVALLVFVNSLSAPQSSHQRFANVDGAEAMPVQLADASAVELMPGAQLMFSAYDDTREATLSGMAHFAVARDEARPFRVRGAGFEVLVMGTVFTVEAGARSHVRVDEGHVRLRGTREADWVDLYAGDVASVVEQLVVLERPGGDLRFENVTLAELRDRLSEARVVTLDMPATLADCLITADFTGSSAPDIAEAVATLVGARMERRADVYVLSGGTCR